LLRFIQLPIRRRQFVLTSVRLLMEMLARGGAGADRDCAREHLIREDVLFSRMYF